LSGNLLLRESRFHIVNCLKSFDFKVFFYTLKLHNDLLLSSNVALERVIKSF